MEELSIRELPGDRRADDPRALVFAVSGPITHHTAQVLREQLRGAIGADRPGPCPHLLFDLSQCADIDVDGLLALVVAQQAARRRGGDLHLIAVPGWVVAQIGEHNITGLLLAEAPAGGDEPNSSQE